MVFSPPTPPPGGAAGAAPGARHHVALSVVGAERLSESGYLRAKIAQERLIGDSSIPFSIVRATQFFEFAVRIADEATVDEVVRLPDALIQPIASRRRRRCSLRDQPEGAR